MIYTINSPSRMGIYHNTARKSIDSIKAELGATFICNLNLFDMAKWQGCCFTKADGKVIATDGYIYDVLAWNSGGKMVKAKSNGTYANAFGCLPIIENGKYCVKSVPAWASGTRQRTAIGIKKDGTPVIYCDTAAKTVAQVANALIKEGVVYAINIDGGASTQCRSDKGNVYGGRVVHTLFYAVEDKPKVSTDGCPYKEPTALIYKGSSGEGAKWVQWMLNRHGAKLDVDGIFGALSDAALRAFQKSHGLVVDGFCGKLTREALKK